MSLKTETIIIRRRLTNRQVLLLLLHAAYPVWITSHDLWSRARLFGKTMMQSQVSARLCELAKDGYVGMAGSSPILFRLTEVGLGYLTAVTPLLSDQELDQFGAGPIQNLTEGCFESIAKVSGRCFI